MKQKIYNIAYSWYESYSQNLFTHPNNKTQAQFEQDVADILKTHIDEFIKTGGDIQKSGWRSWIGNDTVVDLIASKLPTMGYVPYEESFKILSVNIWGSGIIDAQNKAQDLSKYITSAQISAIIKYNKNLNI